VLLRPPTSVISVVVATGAIVAGIAGCGGGSDSSDPAAQAAPRPSDFPATHGQSLQQVYGQGQPDQNLVVSPSGKVYTPGKNRFGFGIFTAGGDQITNAQVAIYAAPGPSGKAQGPYPARVEDLATEPAFEAKTTADDPQSAKAVYVTDIPMNKSGEWRLIAMVRDGDSLKASILPSIKVADNSKIPAVGDKAPVMHTPTVDDVGDVAQIDTREPHDTMHDVDFADVVGKEPVVLLFATPALCVSRVCGPVVDVAEQVKSEMGDDAAFIHMEVYNDNDPNKGIRPQLVDYGLRSEPWLFVIDSSGRVSTRIEGAFSVQELQNALKKAEAS
jgi:hypothetical protein